MFAKRIIESATRSLDEDAVQFLAVDYRAGRRL
jgi:hypothetical protein